MKADDLLVFGLTPQGDVDGHVFYRRIIDRVEQVPGVESVSIVRNRPGTGWSDNNDLTLDGMPQPRVILRSDDVGPDFFRTMGIPLIAGRDVNNADLPGLSPSQLSMRPSSRHSFPIQTQSATC